MSGTLSKRQQARNERALQDLIKSVPGNNVCADCQARNPGWASWSLGIFLCMRCAALHRKMGTHITKVKSLSMDSWSNDQVENMKRVGNIASNRIYNPNNAKPPIPFDADEADSAMERFIRGKYQERAAARHDTGRSSNSDDHPPPLPPKTGSKFGFRSASSIFPLSSKSRRDPPPPVDVLPRRRSPSPEYNNRPVESKPSAKVGTGPLDLAGKMARLRDMGFADPKRNLAVLNGLGGNLEKTIDTLVRLGEGNGNKAGDSSSSRGSRTPITPAFPLSPGLAVNRGRPTPSPKLSSTNPFDLLDLPPPPAQPQSSQSTGSKPNPSMQPAANNPFLSPSMNTNPFGLTPSQSQYSLNQAFQNMAVSNNGQPVQPLFPNHTGGLPAPQQAQYQQHMYQQSAAPSVPLLPTRYATVPLHGGAPQVLEGGHNTNPFMQPQFQQAPQVNTNFQGNPYGQQQIYHSPVEQPTAQQQFPSPSYSQGYQQQSPITRDYTQQLPEVSNGSHPTQFSVSPFDKASQQQPQQSQQQYTPLPFDQNPHAAPQQQSTQQQFPSSVFDHPQNVAQHAQQLQQTPQQHYNPFFAQNNVQQQAPQQTYTFPNQQAQYQQQQQMSQSSYQMPPQQAVKADNRSILDLFNQPQSAPSWPPQETAQLPAQADAQAQNYSAHAQNYAVAAPQQQATNSNPVGNQIAGNRNPFQMAGPGGYAPGQGANPLGNMGHLAPVPQNGSRHVSQESMSIDIGGWQNGRHSPDAWGTISARSVR